MSPPKRYNGEFKYLGFRSNSNDWKRGFIVLEESEGILYLKTHLDANPQRVYKQSEISAENVKECSLKSSRVIIGFKSDVILHFRQSVSDPNRLEDDVNRVLHSLSANGKLLGRNRAEVGCSMPPPPNRIHQSPGHVRSHSHDKEAKSLSDQRVPVSIPTPDSSPGTSPLRFTSMKENRRSCQEKAQKLDEESKENQFRGPISTETDRQGKKGERLPLQVSSSSFYGSTTASLHTTYKKIARRNPILINSSPSPAPFSENKTHLGAKVTYSWNKPNLSSYSSKENTPELQGFANIGNTCYMNAILQSLFSLDTFATDLTTSCRAHNRVLFCGSLAVAMTKLLYGRRKPQLVEMQKTELLRNVKRAISSTAKRFSGSQQHDAHEFLGQVLDQLKEEMLKAAKTSDVNGDCHLAVNMADTASVTPISPPAKDKTSPPNNRCDGAETPESVIKKHPNPFIANPTLANFEFEVVHSIECLSCEEVVRKAEQFNDLSVDIPSSSVAGTQISLQDALSVFFQKEIIEYTCKKCGHKKAEVSHKFSKVPRVLILHLKRYTFDAGMSQNSKMRQQIRIPRFISLWDHCDLTTQPHMPFACVTFSSPSKLSSDLNYKRRKLPHLAQHGNVDEQPNLKVRRLFADEPNSRHCTLAGDSKVGEEQQTKRHDKKGLEHDSFIDLLDEEEKQLKQALALSLKEVSPPNFDHSYTTSSINVEEDANNNAAWNTDHAEMDATADIAESDLEKMTLDQQIAIAINRSLASPSSHIKAFSPSEHFTPSSSPSLSAQAPQECSVSQNKLYTRKSKDYSKNYIQALDSRDTQTSSLLLPQSQKSIETSKGRSQETEDFDGRLTYKTSPPSTAKSFAADKPTDSTVDTINKTIFPEKVIDTAKATGATRSLSGSSIEGGLDEDIFWDAVAEGTNSGSPKELLRQSAGVFQGHRSNTQEGFLTGTSESSLKFNGSSDGHKASGSKNVVEEDSQDRLHKPPLSSKLPSITCFRGSLLSNLDQTGTSAATLQKSGTNSCKASDCKNVCPYPRVKKLKSEVSESRSSWHSENHVLKETVALEASAVLSTVEEKFSMDGKLSDISSENVACISKVREDRSLDRECSMAGEPLITNHEESTEPGFLASMQKVAKQKEFMEEKENILPHDNSLPYQTLQLDSNVEDKIAEHTPKAAEMERGILPYTYRLVSVVNHLGDLSDSGHYVCDAFDMKKQAWFSYDDSKVSCTTESEVLTSRSRSGYIFFYLNKDIYEEFFSLGTKGNELMQKR